MEVISRTFITTLLLLVLTAIIKAHITGIRLLLLAGAGVAGLYMIHLLAQDYNKYQTINRPQNRLALLGRFISKRSIPDALDLDGEIGLMEIEKSMLHGSESTQFPESLKKITSNQDDINEVPEFETILRLDPTGCARRYVCTISTKSPKKLSREEQNILAMFRKVPKNGKISAGQAAFISAIEYGAKTRNPDACTTEYPKCIFTVSQMMKFIGAA